MFIKNKKAETEGKLIDTIKKEHLIPEEQVLNIFT